MTSESLVVARQRGIDGFTHEKEGQWKGPYTFIQGADTQFGMIDEYVNDNWDNPSVEPEVALTTKTIEAVNALNPRPRFMVVCGDLIEGMPGTKWAKDRPKQIKAFKETFKKLHPEIKLVCVCGNHDVGNTPTPESIQSYKEEFGDDYFSFWVGGVKFIVLNSQLYMDDSETKALKEEQNQWLEEVLRNKAAEKPKHVIAFEHVPPFIKDPEEGDVAVEINPKVAYNIPIHERKPLLSKLKAGGVKKVFCGHYHRHAGGWDGDLEVVVTSAIGLQLGPDQHGFRVVNVMENEVQHKYHELDVPTVKKDMKPDGK